MALKLVVKNTFICAVVVEDDATSPMNEFLPRSRAQTSPLEALDLESLGDDEADLSGAPAADLEAKHSACVESGIATPSSQRSSAKSLKLVVKNTFICAVDEDEATSPMDEFQPRRRAQTSPDPWSLPQESEALELESLGDDEAKHSERVDTEDAWEADADTEAVERVDTEEAWEADADTEAVAPPAFEGLDSPPPVKQASSSTMICTTCAETPMTRRHSAEMSMMVGATSIEMAMMGATRLEGLDLPPPVKRVSSSTMSCTTCAETPMTRRSSTETTMKGAASTEMPRTGATPTERRVTGAATSATFFAEPISVADLQRRLAKSSPIEALAVATELRGRVLDAARSPHAHLVLLELIRRLSTENVAFIAAELCGHGRHVASNIYGHVVACRLLEFSAEHPQTVALVDEVLSGDIEALCCHKFGFSLAISVLSNGPQHQKWRIISALSTHVQRFARHRFASQVVEHALLFLHELRECERLVSELLRHQGGVTKLACHCFGTHVVKALLSVPAAAKPVHAMILQAEPRLRKDRYGAKLLEDLGLQQPGPGPRMMMMASLFGA